jgi:hypothetical protein
LLESLAILAVVVGLLGLTVWHTGLTPAARARDLHKLEVRYRGRGHEVLAIRLERIEWLRDGWSKQTPVRIYRVELRKPDGQVEIRLRGISRGALNEDTFWRVNREGGLERLTS